MQIPLQHTCRTPVQCESISSNPPPARLLAFGYATAPVSYGLAYPFRSRQCRAMAVAANYYHPSNLFRLGAFARAVHLLRVIMLHHRARR